MGNAPQHLKSADKSPRDGAWHWLAFIFRTLVISVIAAALSLLGCFVASRFAAFGAPGGWFNRFWFVFFWICLFLVSFVITNRSWLKSKPERILLVVLLCTTALFSWSFSTRLIGWDVGAHYRNILVFADWQGNVDRSASDMIIVTTLPVDTENEGLLATIDNREEMLDENASVYSDTVEHPSNLMWYVTGIEYVPYALTMRLCRTLRISFSHTLTLMRMIGGLFYSIVAYFGMKKLRAGKMLYAVIALLPSSVFLASELGYSYWLFSLCLYGFASLVGMIQGKVQVTPASLIKMLGILFLGMLPRVVYFPLIFLCLFIPTKRFSSKQFARVYRALIVGAALLTLGVWLVPRLMSGIGSGDNRGGEVNPLEQIQYILSHPLDYTNTLLRFIMPPLRMENGGMDVEGANIVSGFLSFEASPGLLTNYGYLPRTHWVYTVAIWCLLVWTTITDKDQNLRYGVLPGLAAVVLAAVTFILIVTALYLDFTPVGLDEIHGVQRRYLLPLVYPVLSFIGPCALGVTGNNPKVSLLVYNSVALLGMVFVLLCSWWTTCVVAIV